MTNKGDDSSGKFGIESTIEMGAGSAELLKDLMEPETLTGDVDDLEEIKEGEEEKKEEEKKEPKKGSAELMESFLNEGEEEEEEEKREEEKEEEEEQDGNQFRALSKDLFKLGVFTNDDDDEEEEINTPEEFLTKFNDEKKKGAMSIIDNFLGQFGEDYRNAFDAIFIKGVKPDDYFGVYNKIVNFAELDMTKEENQESVVRKMLSQQSWEQEDINEEIERLKNYGDLEKVSGKHHKVLVKNEAAELKRMEQQAEELQQHKALLKNEYVRNVQTVLHDKLDKKEFDGIPINVALANELQDFLLVDKYKTASGETLTEFDRTILELKRPENHEKKVKIALLIKLLEKDPTLSTIQRTGVSRKSTALFDEVARQRTKVSQRQPASSKSDTWSIL